MTPTCCLCDCTPYEDALLRVNVKGDDGIWACPTCRRLLPRELIPTDEALTRIDQLRFVIKR